jgi:hypothetical protein
VRWEYISASGKAAEDAINLLYGAGSSATSFTVSPTFQKGGFFVRGELSLVHAMNYAPGSVFGGQGTRENQPRAMAEIGFIFGSNMIEKKP